MSRWHPYEDGRSISNTGAEGEEILCDDEHDQGARLTLKRSREFLSVSGHVYGWTDHTRFFVAESEAQREYKSMKKALDAIMLVIEKADSKDILVWEAISDFVRRFP